MNATAPITGFDLWRVVTGREDRRFEQLGDRLEAGLAHSTRLRLDGGHTVHREDPTFGDRLTSWLASSA